MKKILTTTWRIIDRSIKKEDVEYNLRSLADYIESLSEEEFELLEYDFEQTRPFNKIVRSGVTEFIPHRTQEIKLNIAIEVKK